MHLPSQIANLGYRRITFLSITLCLVLFALYSFRDLDGADTFASVISHIKGQPTSPSRDSNLFVSFGWSWDISDSLHAEDGSCLFVSPFDGLSDVEKRLANSMVFEEAAPGSVRIKKGYKIWSSYEAHPMLGLIKYGEEKWLRHLKRRSSTLREAVRTYQSKWGRPPPKGFDKW